MPSMGRKEQHHNPRQLKQRHGTMPGNSPKHRAKQAQTNPKRGTR